MEKEKFLNPPALYRPAPFWSWNDKFDSGELKRQINEMSEKGWGSYFMHSRVGLVTGYLSEEWMEMIRTCAIEAGKTGTYAWLYDEDKWPSGFAGGEVPEMDEAFRSRALVLLEEPQITEDDTVLRKVEHGGEQYFICKRISPLGEVWFNGASYVDLMNPEAVKAFIECTHERYKKSCGEFFGKEIPGMFTDEPCYLMKSRYKVPVIPWSEYLPAYFYKLKGYRLEENLEELFLDIGDYKKIRYDFYDSATRLFIESFTKPYYDWCEKNNLIMTGHFMAEDNLVYQTQWIGSAMPHYEFMHWPGIDKLGRHLEQVVTVKQLTSVVDQLEKERAFCEVFGCVGQHVSFYHRKWIADWQAALGISFVNHHLSLYSMRGERKRDFPANLFYQQPWWEDERKFSDYLGRLSYAVSQGKRNVDILILHPIGSAWCEYSPLQRENNLMIKNNKYNKSFEELSKTLLANKLDFHYGDEIIMETNAKVENGKLIIGACSYSTVVVPPCCTLKKNTLELIDEFTKQAGPQNVIFVQTFPDRVDGSLENIELPEGVLKAKTVKEAVNILDKRYDQRVSVIDKFTGKDADKILCHMRTTDNGDLIFLANTDEKREVHATIRIPNADKLVVMDLASGKTYKCPAIYDNGNAVLSVKFFPSGSLLLLNDKKFGSYDELPAVLDSGVSFSDCANVNPPCKRFDVSVALDKAVILNDWKVSICEENVLPLGDITLYLDGKKVLDNEPVAKAWHNYFYKAPEGTPFRVEYKFEALDELTGELFAAIEVAENLESISINGHKVKPLKQPGELGAFNPSKSWKDINFTRVPITGFVKKGINTLVLCGRKENNITSPNCHSRVKDFKNHKATEVESVYILGDFQIMNFDDCQFALTSKRITLNSLNVTESGYPFYAGSVEYTTIMEYSGSEEQKTYLKINNVNAASIKLFINDTEVGVKYWNPYIFEVSKCLRKGSNTIKVRATTTLFNVMGPNRIADIMETDFISPWAFIDFDRYTEKYELLPFGIGNGVVFS